MAFEKQGDAMPGTVLRTPTLNMAPFIQALMAHGVDEQTADGIARTIVSLAMAGGRSSWPRASQVGIHGTPYTVVADIKGDMLMLVSITQLSA